MKIKWKLLITGGGKSNGGGGNSKSANAGINLNKKNNI